jgi:NAD(P)-dependent dehydrogenase (short-subunit alcohol dehydrogenase family)
MERPMPKTILVTGATRGIGLELARTLAAQGHSVIGTARNPDDAAKIKDAGAIPEILDVDDEASIAALGSRLASRPLDVLVNNAGISVSCPTLADLRPDDAVRNFRVNAVMPMLVTRALLPSLRAGAGKAVVQVSSIMGSLGSETGGGSYNYRTSKAALNMMNRCLSQELGGEGFTCLVLHPGWVKTDMGGQKAPLTPGESAAGIAKVIAGLTPADNGRFVNYAGAALPW